MDQDILRETMIDPTNQNLIVVGANDILSISLDLDSTSSNR